MVSRATRPDRDAVARMHARLVHRGPDSSGALSVAHACLVVRRLSIHDLRDGAQPLYSEDRSIAVVANAEIYNFVELRAGLASRGHRFTSGNDCEVIAHLYEEQGLECVASLRGMFAFALWDKRRRRLLLARDRIGEKPLYLCEQAGALYFASELKALLASGATARELHPQAVSEYLHFQYVPDPSAPIVGVRKLPAGHTLTVDVDAWRIAETRYWRLDAAVPLHGQPVELIRRELETAAEITLRSDVPVGVALSGGLDSSAVAALARRHHRGALHAFSVGYPGRPSYDERAVAERLARELDLTFQEIELTTEDMVRDFPALAVARDEPIADISGYGYFAVARAARDAGVPVLLQGHGGDELFWGYSWLRNALQESRRRRIAPRRGAADRAALAFYDLSPDFLASERDVPNLLTRQFYDCAMSSPRELFASPEPWPRLDVLLTRLICDTYLRGNGLAQADRLSMAASVETRLPLLDYRVIETVVGLRKAHQDWRLPPKAWLREAVRDLLPIWVLDRPKQGFAPPLRTWHTALFEAYGSMLPDGFLVQHGILRAEAAVGLSSGPFPREQIVPLSFKALVLEMWCRQVLDDRSVVQKDANDLFQDAHRAVCV